MPINTPTLSRPSHFLQTASVSSQPPTIKPFKFILSNATNQQIRTFTPPTISVLSIVYEVPCTDCLRPSIFDGAFTFVMLFAKLYYLWYGSCEAL